MNKLKNAELDKETSIAHLTLEAYSLLEEQGCKACLSGRYIEEFGLCFIVFKDFDNKMLIKAAVFFDLAEENMLTIENIKRNSI